jgi:hypothetical protein
MLPRPTVQSDTLTATQQFVESGTRADFKRCVLEHVEYCGFVFAFWGTASFTPAQAYAPNDVVVAGTHTLRVIEAHEANPIQIPAAQGYEFVLTGTHTTDLWARGGQEDRNAFAFEAFLEDHGVASDRRKISAPCP